MTIRHVTILRLRDSFPAEDWATWQEGLNALPDRIPGIVSLRHGRDLGLVAGQPPGSYALVADFESADALRAYYPHPEHERLKGYSFPNADLVVTVDFEL